MKTYITRINGWSLRDKSHYMQHMVAEMAHQLGCREMGLYRYYADEESWESLGSRLDGIIAGINGGDLIIYQFPTGNGMRFENTLLDRLKAYGGRLAIFIHEIEALVYEEKHSQIGEIISLLNKAEVLIAPTYAMRQWLLENGIHKSMKFVVQEMWDYTVNEPLINAPIFRKEITFTDGEGFAGINDWNYPVPLKLYNTSAGQGNVQNLGEREPYQLLLELNEGGGFGLVWYRDEYSHQSMEQSNSFSLARYLAAGLPVIIPVSCSHRMLIEANHLGIVVSSLEEAAAAVERMTEGEYQDYRKAVEQFAPALRNGCFTKKCLVEAMEAFFRKDAGRFPLPEKVYEAGESIFRTAVLNESYGGNLAFSWDFQGEADGFLIYDTVGTLLGNIFDFHQHYLVLKGQEKEKGVIIKAYVETLKGRLVLAETGPVYVQERSYVEPIVSLIIPAYNAEKFIARSIDTVLAQTFIDLEIIVVDDGSVDHTADIINWYAGKFSNVITIHQKNGTVPAARNTGIKHAKGKYIGFMDNDDMIRPDMILKLYTSIEENDCDIAVTSVNQINNDGYNSFIQYPMEENIAIEIENFFDMHFNTGCMFSVVVWNKLYRTSLLKKRLFPVLLYDDEAWTPYILSYADKICYVNSFLYEYDRTIRNNTLIDKWVSTPKDEMFMVHKKTVLFYLNNGNQKRISLLKKLAKRQLLEMGRAYSYDKYERLWKEIDNSF